MVSFDLGGSDNMAKKASKANRAVKSKKAKAELTEQAKKAIDIADASAGASAESAEQTVAETAAPTAQELPMTAVDTVAPKQENAEASKTVKANTERPAAKGRAKASGKKAETAKKKAVKGKTEKKPVEAKEAAASAKTAKKPGPKPMTEAEKKARAAEKEKAANMVPTLTLQYAGREVAVEALIDAVKADFKAKNKRTYLTDLKLYMKPEDGAVYYVANETINGKVDF